MQNPIGIILAAIFGAIITGLASESYKRHRDRAGTASAIAGEISAIIDMTQRRSYVALYSTLLDDLTKGINVQCPDVIDEERDHSPVITAYLERIGSLGGDLPERIARFHQYFSGIRYDMVRLGKGVFESMPNATQTKAFLIQQNLQLWAEAVTLGQSLVRELKVIAQEKWCGWIA